MGQCVHTDMIVSDVHTHGLFSHSRLVCVTRRLLIISDKNKKSTVKGKMASLPKVENLFNVYNFCVFTLAQ